MGLFKRKSQLKAIEKKDEALTVEQSMAEKVGDNSVEQGMPDLSSPTEKNNSVNKVILVGGGLFAAGLIIAGLIVFTSGGDDELEAKKDEKTELVSNTQSHDFSKEKEEIKEDEAIKAAVASEAAAASAVEGQPPKEVPTLVEQQPEVPVIQKTETVPLEPETQAQVPMPTPTVTADESNKVFFEKAENNVKTPKERRLEGEVLLPDFINSNGGASVHAGEILKNSDTSGTDDDDEENDDGKKGGEKNATFTQKLKLTITASTIARKRADATYLLAKGTNIACTLDTQIITTHAGFTRCLVSKDVYSANGKVLLLERGTKIIGEQTSALLQGQARVFVLWNEVETPNGVKVALASPSAGQLGAAGVGARVKYHFWQRFGGAIMISLIGDFGENISNRRNKGNGQQITFENTTEAAQDMATEALKNSINIPPTAYINHGTRINIMVARDVDFGQVYERVNPYQMY